MSYTIPITDLSTIIEFDIKFNIQDMKSFLSSCGYSNTQNIAPAALVTWIDENGVYRRSKTPVEFSSTSRYLAYKSGQSLPSRNDSSLADQLDLITTFKNEIKTRFLAALVQADTSSSPSA